MHRSHVAMSLALLPFLLFAGCAGKSAQLAEQTAAPAGTGADSDLGVETVSIEEVILEHTRSEAVTRAPDPAAELPTPEAGELQIVFFDHDSSVLTAAARRILARHAQWLRENQQATATIEGHCDERGSEKYNLTLGEKRAAATREYLVAQGVAPKRLETVSYGEGRPVRGGHDETAWEKNRRVEFR